MAAYPRHTQRPGHQPSSPTPSDGSATLVGSPARSLKTAASPTLRGDSSTIGFRTPPPPYSKGLPPPYPVVPPTQENSYIHHALQGGPEFEFDLRQGTPSMYAPSGPYGLDAEAFPVPNGHRIRQLSVVVYDIFVVDVCARGSYLTIRDVFDGISRGLYNSLSREEIGKVTRRGTHVPIVPGQTRRIDILPCHTFGGLVLTGPNQAVMHIRRKS